MTPPPIRPACPTAFFHGTISSNGQGTAGGERKLLFAFTFDKVIRLAFSCSSTGNPLGSDRKWFMLPRSNRIDCFAMSSFILQSVVY
jgi:hypothetical protein